MKNLVGRKVDTGDGGVEINAYHNIFKCNKKKNRFSENKVYQNLEMFQMSKKKLLSENKFRILTK